VIAAFLLRLGVPRWVAIAALCAAAAGAAIAYRAHLIHIGVSLEAARRDVIDAENSARARAALTQINAKLASTQAQLTAALAHLDQLKSDLDHEKAASTALQSDLAAGRRRLSVLTRTRAPDSAGSTQSAAAPGVDPGGEPATATLDGRVASDLEWARSTRNEAIIALQACTAAYDAVETAAK
jgi:hypothetical protein